MTTAIATFGRVLTAMVTPFDADGSLDLDGAVKLATYLTTEGGNDGLIIAGTTGESPTLTHDEQIELIGAVAEAIDGPVVAGAGSNDTQAAVELTERATAAGAAGLLHVTPYYNRPSQAGLLDHFRACAAATDMPVLLYDIKGRTGRPISMETMLELFETVDNIIGVKDANGDPAQTARLLSLAPPDTEVYSGDDPLTLALLATGAVGTIGVATHWIGNETQQMMDAFFGGDIAKAIELNRLMIPSYSFETGDLAPNPIPTKAMLRLMGLPAGPTRPPMGPEPEFVEIEAKAVLAGLGRAERRMAAPVTITFLGGLGQIGRNCAAIETEGRIVVLDCGQMFGGDDLPGVDAVLPDLSYLIENANRVGAVIATHAHEDHIGALPYLLTHLSLPIYGSPFTLGMIDHKLRERGLQKNAELRPVHDGDRIDIGPFDCEFLPVTHSIPRATSRRSAPRRA